MSLARARLYIMFSDACPRGVTEMRWRAMLKFLRLHPFPDDDEE